MMQMLMLLIVSVIIEFSPNKSSTSLTSLFIHSACAHRLSVVSILYSTASCSVVVFLCTVSVCLWLSVSLSPVLPTLPRLLFYRLLKHRA